MYAVFVIVAALVIFAVAAAATGRASGLGPEPDDVPKLELPEGELEPADLDRVRFAVAVRGYRMDQVDEVLTRARDELVARDQRIAELEGRRGAADPSLRRPGWPEPAR